MTVTTRPNTLSADIWDEPVRGAIEDASAVLRRLDPDIGKPVADAIEQTRARARHVDSTRAKLTDLASSTLPREQIRNEFRSLKLNRRADEPARPDVRGEAAARLIQMAEPAPAKDPNEARETVKALVDRGAVHGGELERLARTHPDIAATVRSPWGRAYLAEHAPADADSVIDAGFGVGAPGSRTVQAVQALGALMVIEDTQGAIDMQLDALDKTADAPPPLRPGIDR